MVGAIQGGAVLVLLSVFLAHMLAPAVAGIRRRVRIGPRQRPISRPVAIVLLYLAVFVPGGLLWRGAQDDAVHWVRVTAPRSVERMFTGSNFQPFERLLLRAPISALARRGLVERLEKFVNYVEQEVRATLNELIAAARYAEWLAVTPVMAFLLLSAAPGFQRSTLRALPHGHLQWRAEEYLRDVNSALAGYVRAQVAAAIIVGFACVAGFALIGVASAVSLGVTAGVLELVPAIGPLTAFIVAGSQAGDRALAVIAFLGGLRIIQDYVIYPRLVRRGMHMSTLAVILTIWLGAVLAGAAGVILAIPVAGFLSVSWRHWREYREIERLVRSRALRQSE
jgi:predicted PurR-regulated permease PerM